MNAPTTQTRRGFFVRAAYLAVFTVTLLITRLGFANPLLMLLKRRKSEMSVNTANWPFYFASSGTKRWDMTLTADATAPIGKNITLAAPSTSTDVFRWLPAGTTLTDGEVLARFKGQNPTSGSPVSGPGIYFRVSDAGSGPNGYRMTLIVTATLKRKLRISEIAAGVPTTLVTGTTDLTYTTGTWYWMRCRIQGSTFTGKIWAVGTAEPGSWEVTATDATFTSGLVGWGVGEVNWSPVSIAYFDVVTGTNSVPLG